MSLFSAGCSVFGLGTEERPSHTVVVKDGDREIRRYGSYIVAKTTVVGSFKEAQSKGFRILAGYIFGKNVSQQKIAMTAPVVQEPESEKISMTAPVVLRPADTKSWTMTFSMPASYTLETLPKPIDERVVLEKTEERVVAVLTFSGLWNEEKIQEKGAELSAWLAKHQNFEIASAPMFAGYNPPWTLPFLRTNEVLIELKAK